MPRVSSAVTAMPPWCPAELCGPGPFSPHPHHDLAHININTHTLRLGGSGDLWKQNHFSEVNANSTHHPLKFCLRSKQPNSICFMHFYMISEINKLLNDRKVIHTKHYLKYIFTFWNTEALCVLNSAKCSEFPPELVFTGGVCDMFALICSICLLILSLGWQRRGSAT